MMRWVLISSLVVFPNFARAETIATSLQATYSLATLLTEGTGFDVIQLPTRAVPLGAQAKRLEFEEGRLAETLAAVDIVVSLGRLYTEDTLFAAVRHHNIRAVEIDAAIPIEQDALSVSVLARQPDQGGATPAWLSLGNALRMTEIVGLGLERLAAPEDVPRIVANKAALVAELSQMSAEVQSRLLSAPDAAGILMGSSFDILASEMGIFPLLRTNDLNWQDAEDFTWALDEPGVIVIGNTAADEALTALLDAHDTPFVKIDDMNPGTTGPNGTFDAHGYLRGLCHNLQAILTAIDPDIEALTCAQ